MIFSCDNKKNETNNHDTAENTLTIKYNDVINNHRIKIVWKPRVEYYGYIGSAHIILTNVKTNRTSYVINNYCSIEDNIIKKIKILDENKFLKLDEDYVFEVDYKSNNSSFYFQDINYDGNDELFIEESGIAQRGGNAIKVYKFSSGMLSDYVYFWQLLNYEPFNSLDDMSIIDLENKKIEIYGSNGVCAGTYDEYIYNNRWIYSRHIAEKEFDFECYNYIYKVVKSEIRPYRDYNFELISIDKQ